MDEESGNQVGELEERGEIRKRRETEGRKGERKEGTRADLIVHDSSDSFRFGEVRLEMLFVPVVESLDGWRVLGGSRSSGGRCDGGSLRLSRRSDVSSNVVSHRGSWRFEKRRGGAAIPMFSREESVEL